MNYLRHIEVKAFLFVEKLPDSAVLVTARPSANEDILLRSSKPQKRIEVLGFDQKSVEAYVSGVFKDEPEKLNSLLFSKQPSCQYDACSFECSYSDVLK
jgi:hypothetical protein